MGGIGGMELLVVGLVALIVVGPKDLPGMFRTVGQFTGKAKRMAREFSSAMEAAADDAGVSDVTNTLKAATNPVKAATKAASDAVNKSINPDTFEDGSATQALSKERAEAAEKIRNHSSKLAQDRLDREAAEAGSATQAKAARKTPAKAKAAAKAAAKPKAAPKSAAKSTAKSAAKSAPKAAAKPKAKPATKSAAKPAARKPAAKKASS